MAKSKLKNCIHCGAEIATSVTKCPQCGGKNKKPIYKRVWFIALMVFVVLSIIGGACGDTSTTTPTDTSTSSDVTDNVEAEAEQVPTITYIPYNVNELMNDLNTNALNASEKYNGQYVEITGRLASIDSNGQYISVLPTDDEWAFVGVSCYIVNDDQKSQVTQLAIDDIVTVRGKIEEVGDVLGYYLTIDEIVIQ